MSSDLYEKIYAVVRRIPRGRVASYGQIARLARLEGYARHVGYAMNALPDDSDVPWHRVINAQGAISPRAIPDGAYWQRHLLEEEGVTFDARGRIALQKFWWKKDK